MSNRWRVAAALLTAVPIEVWNLSLVGQMFDPGISPPGVMPKLTEAEWVFFHYAGFHLADRIFGSGDGAVIVAFVIAYSDSILHFGRPSDSSFLETQAKQTAGQLSHVSTEHHMCAS